MDSNDDENSSFSAFEDNIISRFMGIHAIPSERINTLAPRRNAKASNPLDSEQQKSSICVPTLGLWEWHHLREMSVYNLPRLKRERAPTIPRRQTHFVRQPPPQWVTVQGIPKSAIEEALSSCFRSAGPILEVRWHHNCLMLLYKNLESAMRAEHFDGCTINEYSVRVYPTCPIDQPPKQPSVQRSGLSQCQNLEELKETYNYSLQRSGLSQHQNLEEPKGTYNYSSVKGLAQMPGASSESFLEHAFYFLKRIYTDKWFLR